ncbi:WD40-repeat-containing domain protein [Phlebopus sp. FC_14]|nr:WD40-repeat-containing domain protein [Phlebopus sp. FC_14]
MGPLSGNEELGIITHVSFVTDDLILSASDSIMHQWDAHSGEFNPDQFKGHEDPVIIAACLPDRRTIASLGKEGVVLLWDRHTLEIVHDFLVGLDSAVVAAFSLDGTKLVAIQRGRCCIWDVERGEMITEFIETPMAAMQLCVAFVSDSTHVIIGYGDGYLRRWDIESWEMVGVPFGGHDQPIVFIVCSPDGKLIATSAFDAKTHLWDGETHEVLTQMDGSGTLVFSPDSRYSARSTVNRQLIIDEIIMVYSNRTHFEERPQSGPSGSHVVPSSRYC